MKRAQLQTLRRNFELLEMKTGESVTDYFSRVMVVANDMRNCGDDMQDVKVVEKIMRTLTDNFNYIVCSIEESKDIDNLSVDSLQSSLRVHEQKMRKMSINEDDQVLKVAFDDRGGRNRGRIGQERGRGRGSGGGRAFNKATIECFKCHRLGHFQYECPTWDGKVNYADVDDEKDDVLLMAFTEDYQKHEAWFLDSGCSNHMSGNKAWFSTFDENFRHSVKLGNNSQLQVMGKGDVSLQLEEGTHIISETPMTANKLFKVMADVKGSKAGPECYQTTSMDDFHLWHCRYGHLNYKGLRTLKYQNMVRGIPHLKKDGEDKACVSCLTGKQHREPIPKKSLWRSSRRLQLVHSDLCGPISQASNSGKRYILTFIDDFSRKVWVYFLSNKSDTFVMFTRFKSQVERERQEKHWCA